MDKIASKLLNKYLCGVTFLVATVIYCFAPAMPVMDRLINVLLIWIALCMVYDLVKFRQPFSRDNLVLIAFFAWFTICVVVGGVQSVGIKMCIYVLIQVVFLSNIFRGGNLKERFDRLASVLSVLGLVVNLASVVLYFLSYGRTYVNEVMDMSLRLGKHWNGSLSGVLCNCNWTGFFALLIAGMAVYKLLEKKHVVFHSINLFLALCVIACCNSRGTLVGLGVFAVSGLVLWFISCRPFQKKRAGKFILLLAGMCIALTVVVAGIKEGRVVVFKVLEPYTAHIAEMSGNASAVTERDEQEQAGSSATRLTLWKLGLEIVKEHPVFGVGYQNIGDEIWERNTSDLIDSEALAANTHNVYIQVAVASGIVGLLLFLACICLPLLKGIVLLCTERRQNSALVVAVALVLSFCAINLVEADIIVSRNFMSTAFWMLLGFLHVSTLPEMRAISR